MHIYHSALSRTTHIPRQLDYLQAAGRRNLLTVKDQSLLASLEKGAIGEQIVLEYLEKYGRSHWTVIQNLWMDHFGTYETDLMLLTGHAKIPLEVKNYQGMFEYKDSRCFIDGRRQRENPIHQAEKSFLNAKDIGRQISSRLNVYGALIFIGEHNQVDIQSPVEGIKVVTKAGLPNFIQTIANREDTIPYDTLPHEQIVPHFEEKEVLNPYGPETSYNPADVLLGRRGVSCRECSNFDLETTRCFVKCPCGFVENRREAIIRTIHEFGMLTFDHDFMYRRDLEAFMDGQVKKTLLLEILNTYFEPVENSRYTKYPNKKRIYEL